MVLLVFFGGMNYARVVRLGVEEAGLRTVHVR